MAGLYHWNYPNRNSFYSSKLCAMKLIIFLTNTSESDCTQFIKIYIYIYICSDLVSFVQACANGTIRSASGPDCICASGTFLSNETFHGLVAWYKFGSTSALLSDSSGNGRTLSNANSVQFDATDGKDGTGSTSFSGSNYLQIANDGTFSPPEFTVTCWCKIVPKTGSGESYSAIASAREARADPPHRGWIIYVTNSDLEFWTGADQWDGGHTTVYPGFVPTTPTWRHLAISLQQLTGQMKLYVDNQLVGTFTRTYVLNPTTNLRLGAGSNEGAARYHLAAGSKLDDFRFFSRVLSEAEIHLIFSKPLDCTPCSAGSYSTATGATSATACLPCAVGKMSAAGASECTPVRSFKACFLQIIWCSLCLLSVIN